MTIPEIVLNDVAIQPLTQKIEDLKKIFNELTYSHLPVEKDGVYIGSVSENDIRCFEEEKTLEDYRYALVPFFVRTSHPLLDILRTFSNNDTNLLPVLDDENNTYLGYLELNDIMAILDETPFFGEEGAIIVVEKEQNDYSFSEISQIVESNEGNLFGSYINKMSEGIVQVTLKISEIAVNEILQTFRRYDYKIISGHQEDTFIQNLEERSDYLNKFLNI